MRILYHVDSADHFRIVGLLDKIKGVEQEIICPSTFKRCHSIIKKIPCSSGKQMKEHVQKFGPDVLVVSSAGSGMVKYCSNLGIKIVYAPHGFVDRVSDKNKVIASRKGYWEYFDLIFVANKEHKILFENSGLVLKAEIVVGVIPHLDKIYKEKLSATTIPGKIVIPMHKTGSNLFMPFNDILFNSIRMGSMLAKENNWDLFVKPKKSIGHKVRSIILKDKCKNVHLLPYLSSPYEHFCSANAIICSARSSIHIESCLLGVPLGILADKSGYVDDTFNTMDFGASIPIRTDTVDNMREDMFNLLGSNMKDEQKSFCDSMGLVLDGKHGSRFQKKIIQKFGGKK
jgi:predicted Fe-Mo cluster-binding NifX family protein